MIILPYPDKALWPNGRAHWAVKAREAKKLRTAAALAAKAARIRIGDSPIPVHIVVYPKATGPAPDKDNCTAAAKSAIDGIADALGINDRHFAAPTVEVSQERSGKFVFYIGEKA